MQHAVKKISRFVSRTVQNDSMFPDILRWCINVPILFLLSGHCSLGRPVKEISRPLMVTNVYIIFSWMATVTESALLKPGQIAVQVSILIICLLINIAYIVALLSLGDLRKQSQANL